MVRGQGIRLRAMIGKRVGRCAERELKGQREHEKKEATNGALIMPARENQGGERHARGGAERERARKAQRKSRSRTENDRERAGAIQTGAGLMVGERY